MFKVWLIVITLGVDGSSIVDVQHTKTPFDSYESCERAKPRAVAKLDKENKNYVVFCKATDRGV